MLAVVDDPRRPASPLRRRRDAGPRRPRPSLPSGSATQLGGRSRIGIGGVARERGRHRVVVRRGQDRAPGRGSTDQRIAVRHRRPPGRAADRSRAQQHEVTRDRGDHRVPAVDGRLAHDPGHGPGLGRERLRAGRRRVGAQRPPQHARLPARTHRRPGPGGRPRTDAAGSPSTWPAWPTPLPRDSGLRSDVLLGPDPGLGHQAVHAEQLGEQVAVSGQGPEHRADADAMSRAVYDDQLVAGRDRAFLEHAEIRARAAQAP